MKKILLLILLVGAIGAYGYAVKKSILPNTLHISFLEPEIEQTEREDFPFDVNEYGNMVAKKPIIYLYPEKTTNVEVKLDFNGELIATYPTYNNGWSVTAEPDGTLTNHADGREYSYLFWEGLYSHDWNLSTGFVVRAEDTISFLQEKLAKLGLTPREYNEFIVYWYPLMKNNPYNLIHFADKEYTDTAPLTITPTPDSLLRVFMVYKPLTEKIEIPAQSLSSFERKGFSVVEWGGTEVR
jgi:hypothetical protein